MSNSWAKAIVSVTNNTGSAVGSGNYTFTVNDFGTGTLSNATASMIAPWNVTYSWYNTSRSDWTVANQAALGLGEYGNWFKIIVIVGVASLVLALIFMAFGKGRTGSQTTSGSY